VIPLPIKPLDGAFGDRTLQFFLKKTNSMKGGVTMGKQIQWETSLTTAKAKAKKEKKLILMDFYNNL